MGLTPRLIGLIPTGPKLYKEPSAKSNKYIIQNALAHCCLAGKVNEGQKNKILDVRFADMCLCFSALNMPQQTNTLLSPSLRAGNGEIRSQ